MQEKLVKILKTNIKIIAALIIGVILSTFFSCCFAETLINSKDVYYKDNSNLLANNVQDAIDGTCTKFDNSLTNLKKEMLNEMYPVGSIYISTTLSTAAQVKAALGGEWEVYGNGKVLRGINGGTSGTTGGSEMVTLSTDNLPSHNHSISVLSGTAASAGEHTHTVSTQASTTGSTGGGKSFSTLDPYITVYMYRRTK